MKKHLLKFKSWLLLLCMIVGATSSALADEYELITSASDLVAGDQYLFVCEADNAAMGAIGGSTSIGARVITTISTNTITATSDMNVITLGGETGEWTFYTSKESKYLSWTNGNSLAVNGTVNGNAQKWTISFSGNNAVIANKGTTARKIQYNKTNPRFACYTSSQTAIQIYKKKAVVTVPPTITFKDGSVRVGQDLDLSTLFSSTSAGAVTYSITDGGSYASLNGTTLTGVEVGSVTVKAEQTAAGNYNAGEASATITVNAALALSSIAITTAPTKTTYIEGETFDPTGMVVTATYSDETTEDVTASCTFSPSTALTTSDTEITISYTENAVEKTTTQTITVNALPKYTVTFADDSSTETQASYGAEVMLPSRSETAGYAFAGWSTTNVPTETTTAPTIIPAGSYTPTTNIILYPVYTKTEGGGGSQNKTTSVTVAELAEANSWISGTKYTSATLDENVTATVSNGGGNTGKYYSSGDGSWRFYASESGELTISTTSGELTNVTITYTGNTLTYNENNVTSGTAVSVSGTSAQFAVSGSSSNSQITAISVNYTIANAGTTYYWSAPEAAAVEKPTITVAENPFLFSTTATITCETEGAAIKYSFDNETWTEYTTALTITATTTIYAKAVKDPNESTVASVTATKNLATPTVTISGAGITNTNVYTGTAAGSLAATVTYNEAAVDGADVTWSSNNADVAIINAETGAVTLVAAGSVTFTATYAGNSDYAEKTATYEMTVTNVDPNAPGTENNPYTVAQAIEATPASGTSANVYIRGIVSAFYGENTDITGDYSHRYYISDDGTTTGQLLVYNGKGLNNVAFSAAEDLQLGDVVVILGGLTTYKGDAEVAANNYIVSLKRKTVPGLAWNRDAFEAVNGEENVYPTLTNTNSVAVTYSSSNESVATIADNGIITLVANGETTITASFAGNSDYLEQEVSYTLTVSGFSKDAAGIAFAESEVNITFGDEFAGQALTNPNSLTVTYSSNDEDVALVDENTGEVIIGNAGSATITATFIENEDYLGAVVTYTINVAKAAAGLSFDETSFKVAPDAEFEAPTLNNPNSLTTVTYSSSDEKVALVDENTGEVLILDEGTATITAAFAGNDNYLAGNATYTINITSILDITWDLSTDNTTTASGTEMSWVASPAAMRVDKANSGTATNNYYPGTAGKTYTSTRFYNGSKLTISPAFGYQITSVEFTATSDGYATALKNSAWTNATAAVSEKTVTVTPINGLKAMTATIGGTCGFSSVIVYYKEATSAYITLAEACTDGEGMYYGTFSSPKAFVVPEDIVVSEIAIVDNKLFVEEYATGAIVPANTGVMVSSTTSGEHSVAFSTGGTSVLGEDNRLRASGAGITAEAMAAADSECLFYRLTMHNGTDIGFWWGAAEGAAFNLAANKAYLAVPSAVSVKGFSLFSDDETGITEVAEKTEGTEKVFDLSGRRVVKPTKGLYIVNGKKYIKK